MTDFRCDREKQRKVVRQYERLNSLIALACQGISTVFDSLPKAVVVYSCNSCPACNSVSLPVDCKHTVAPGVVCLFNNSSPSTVFRLVVPVVVDAVNRMFWGWSVPHVFKEIFKGFLPSIANLYSPTSILLVGCVVRFKASRSKILPANEFFCVCPIFGMSVLELSDQPGFSLQTSARPNLSHPKSFSVKTAATSTSAVAHPIMNASQDRPFFVVTQNGQTIKNLARQIQYGFFSKAFIIFKTSARLSSACCQMTSSNVFRSAAIANTSPHSFPIAVSSPPVDDKRPKTVCGQVFQVWHEFTTLFLVLITQIYCNPQESIIGGAA